MKHSSGALLRAILGYVPHVWRLWMPHRRNRFACSRVWIVRTLCCAVLLLGCFVRIGAHYPLPLLFVGAAVAANAGERGADAGGSSSALKKEIRPFNTVAFRGPLKSLPKWERVLRENKRNPVLQRNTLSHGPSGASGRSWSGLLQQAKASSDMEKVRLVNSFFNRWPYRLDIDVYGVADFWATPYEFIRYSGDCEDYAISKYFALRKLGFSAKVLRIVVLMDTIRGIGHAVLLVYMEDTAYVLDNVTDLVLPHARYTHYRPHYSVNENYRWAHVPVRPASRQGG